MNFVENEAIYVVIKDNLSHLLKKMLSFRGKNIMIRVTRLNGSNYVLNCEFIETIEATPDTVITTTNGKKLVVAEAVDEIVDRVIEYKAKIQLINRVD